MKKLISLAFFAFLVFAPFFAAPETFYVKKLQSVKIDKKAKTEKTVLPADCAALLEIPENHSFLSEIEIEIKIPQEVLVDNLKFSYAVFSNVTVENSDDSAPKKIFAERVFSENFPSRLSVFVKIPLNSENAQQKDSPYAKVIPADFSKDETTIFFAIFPPEKLANFADFQFEILIRPILAPRGFLNLKLDYPDGERKPVNLLVNEMEISDWSSAVELPEGEYHAVVSSEFFRTEVRYFVIEKGKTTSLKIALRDIKPHISLSAPDGVSATLDGKPAAIYEEIVVSVGQHIVRFYLGSFEIVRTIVTSAGKNYNISCDVDVSIEENE